LHKHLKLYYLYATFFFADRISAGHLPETISLNRNTKNIRFMLAEFSFIRHPLLKIMRFAHVLIPGIERIDVVFFDEKTKTLFARTRTKEMAFPFGKIMELDGAKNDIDKLRKTKARFMWVERQELPWNPPGDENIRKDLLSKMESLVLIIGVDSREKNNLKDLAIFYFNDDLSNLLITSRDKISARERDFVGSAYHSAVSAMIKASQVDMDVWEDFAPLLKNNEQVIDHLRMELKLMRKMYQERLVASCEFYLSKISMQFGRQYHFSEGAAEQIKQYEGEYFKLENAIKAGVRIANNLWGDNAAESIEIKESYLNFNTSRQIADIHDIHIQTELEKPFNYLNQIEEIALELRRTNLPVTGKNVASKMNPPVQPPSITMYLNSNQQKILKLFNFYTDKWKILRTDFKPTFNILENAKNRPHQRS
jgi:hypothetical protein